jgi:hypothetical protein
MTEKTMRERLASARPAEVPIVCMYLVAAVFEGPPPPPPEIVFGISPGMTEANGAFITVSYQSPSARRKARKKRGK